MNRKLAHYTLFAWASTVIAIAILCLLSSCHGPRVVTKTVNTRDSLLQRWEDSARMENAAREGRWQHEIERASEESIRFTDRPCPPAKINGCDTGALVARIRTLEAALAKKPNKAEFYESGKVKSVEGDIKEIRAQAESHAQEAEVWKEKYSLAIVTSDSLKTRLTQTSKELEKERKADPWLYWFLAGFGSCTAIVLLIKYRHKMKKLITALLAIVCIAMLASCGHFHDEPKVSVWAGQLWVLPVIGFGAAVVLFYFGWRAMKSGTTQQTRDAGTVDVPGKEPWYKIPQILWAIVVFVLTIGVIIYTNSGWWR